MKKRMIGVLTLLMVVIGSCATLAVATPITTLGDIDYYNAQDNFCINEHIPGNANLSLIYSEVNESGLKLDKVWYDSSTDNTTYKFTTQKIYVEWWFTPDIKEFVYIDETTNNLYQVNVNYSLIDIPENPYEERHQQIVENYTLILNNYNLTNETLTNITLQFNKLNDTYNQKMQLLNITLTEEHNLFENLTALRANFSKLEADYNKTDSWWKNAVDNISYYQLENNDLLENYSKLKKDHSALTGALPGYIFITIVGVFLFTWIYLRRKTIFGAVPEATNEITTGYGKIHSVLDKHILSQFRRRDVKTEEESNKGGIEEVMLEEVKEPLRITTEETPTQKEIKKESYPDFLELENKIDEKIDAVVSTHKTFQKSIVTDFLTLSKRLDKVEADVKKLMDN